MSKYVKNMITDDLRKRWAGVNDMLVVSVAGLDANKTYQLRKELRSQNIQLLVVKNSLARRAVEGTPLAAAFEQMEGSLACMWGSTDIVSLAKVVAKLADKKDMAPFAPRGGVMDGARLSAQQVKEVSKWPSREEQLSLLLGQILSPGAKLASQLTSAGGALASQIKQKSEEKDAPAAEVAPA
ncbi:MAG TPA: 50S ribosomal protein L10 [Pirellulales bacterium]|jgi:ribosomal protein L10|nr:50S ribosomal protein L10 [Pirellulales bacterium]